jgi:hypothetical protein
VKTPYKAFPGIVIAIAAVFFAAAVPLAGQNSARNIFGITVGAGLPMGLFKTNLGKDGFQFDLYYARKLKSAPLFIGFDCAFFIYGMSTRQEPLENIPEVNVDVETSNSVIQGLFFIRLQPAKGPFRPYIEGLAGVSYLSTDTTITEREFPWDEIASDTNFSDFALAAGGGAGVEVHLWGVLDIKARYLTGSKAKYLKEGSIVYEGGQAVYLYQESATNLLSFQAGVSFRF